MPKEMIAILDFGSQYSQLIARRVREHNVYSKIFNADTPATRLSQSHIKGLILSGGPASVYEQNAPKPDKAIFDLNVPILGICYGMQLGCQMLGAQILPTQKHEYGRTNLHILDKTDLFANLTDSTVVWASHADQIVDLGSEFVTLATTESCPFAAVRHKKGNSSASSFTLRSLTRQKARRYCKTSFTISVTVAAIGKLAISSVKPSSRFALWSATVR